MHSRLWRALRFATGAIEEYRVSVTSLPLNDVLYRLLESVGIKSLSMCPILPLVEHLLAQIQIDIDTFADWHPKAAEHQGDDTIIL